jgi:hypothetical protein
MTDRKERAHNVGTEFTRTGEEPGAEQSFVDQAIEFADKAVDEAARIGKAAMEKDNRGRVAAGAAVGAVGAIVLPIVSLPLGALAGAGYVAWRAARGKD